jgi:hypothetical protein
VFASHTQLFSPEGARATGFDGESVVEFGYGGGAVGNGGLAPPLYGPTLSRRTWQVRQDCPSRRTVVAREEFVDYRRLQQRSLVTVVGARARGSCVLHGVILCVDQRYGIDVSEPGSVYSSFSVSVVNWTLHLLASAVSAQALRLAATARSVHKHSDLQPHMLLLA